jgi:hypothetical protein
MHLNNQSRFSSSSRSNIHISNTSNITNDNLIGLMKQSSFVLFVVSKNLFTSVEYDLAAQTPKPKKLAILADDISESVADKLIQPNKILKATFNLTNMSFNFKSINSREFQVTTDSSSSSSSSSASSASSETITTTSAASSPNSEIFFGETTTTTTLASASSVLVNESHLLRHDNLLKKNLPIFNKFEF